jgi:hypothetical protein
MSTVFKLIIFIFSGRRFPTEFKDVSEVHLIIDCGTINL